MLFLVEGHLVDIVRENGYRDVLTVRADSRKALRVFASRTGGQPVRVADVNYPWVIHVPRHNLPFEVSDKYFNDSELVPLLTPPPAAYFYDYCTENEDGEIQPDYGYCWPSEIAKVKHQLLNTEFPALEEPVFIPIFFLPSELITVSATLEDFKRKLQEDSEN